MIFFSLNLDWGAKINYRSLRPFLNLSPLSLISLTPPPFQGTVPPGCILNGGTVPPGCILNGGTVPPFNLFLYLLHNRSEHFLIMSTVSVWSWSRGCVRNAFFRKLRIWHYSRKTIDPIECMDLPGDRTSPNHRAACWARGRGPSLTSWIPFSSSCMKSFGYLSVGCKYDWNSIHVPLAAASVSFLRLSRLFQVYFKVAQVSTRFP